ncbi:MAG TPA: hypothetical protein VGR28_04265 [Candidatus Thermoplasmatota archaeon]|jgi:hypothetical protein|nr:hypothetical protein [Candidatus Thermoplasmatota archaeon]
MPALSSWALLEVATRERERRKLRLGVPHVVLMIGVAYFLWVALIGSNVIVLKGLEPTITLDDWAQWGAGLMVLLLLVLLLDYRRKGVRAEVAAPGPRPITGERRAQDELVVTAEVWKGFRVLEYSHPAKSDHPTAVYAKCHVPVDATYAVRVEDLVADARP